MGTIRLILAFSVVITHVLWTEVPGFILPGQVAVQVFFVISGFYMALILKNKYAERSYGFFLTNRLLRLFPAYLFVLAISFLVLQGAGEWIFLSRQDFNQAISSNLSTAIAILWVNLVTVGQELGFLVGLDPSTFVFFWANHETLDMERAFRYILVPPAWSISMEICFYLLAPFLIRCRMKWLSVLFVASVALRFFILSHGDEFENLERRCFPAELWLFICGMFSYEWYYKRQHILKKYLLPGIISWTVLFSALALYNKLDDRYAIFVLALITTVTIPFLFAWSQDSKLDRLAGNLSFSVYLLHMMIIQCFDLYLQAPPLFLVLLATTIAAFGLYYGIERPVDHWRQGRITTMGILGKQGRATDLFSLSTQTET